MDQKCQGLSASADWTLRSLFRDLDIQRLTLCYSAYVSTVSLFPFSLWAQLGARTSLSKSKNPFPHQTVIKSTPALTGLSTFSRRHTSPSPLPTKPPKNEYPWPCHFFFVLLLGSLLDMRDGREREECCNERDLPTVSIGLGS